VLQDVLANAQPDRALEMAGVGRAADDDDWQIGSSLSNRLDQIEPGRMTGVLR
jgi:hypothetical protein